MGFGFFCLIFKSSLAVTWKSELLCHLQPQLITSFLSHLTLYLKDQIIKTDKLNDLLNTVVPAF